MKEDDELEMLLDEIPHATSHNIQNHHHRPLVHMRPQHHHHDTHGGHHGHVHGHGHGHGNGNGSFVGHPVNGMYDMYDDDYKYTFASSPVSGFSLQSDGSSSSLLSNGHSVSDNGSPTPPPLEELKSQMHCGNSHYTAGLLLDSKVLNSADRKKANDRLIDELGLPRNLSKMCISNEQENSSKLEEFSVDPNGFGFRNNSVNRINLFNVENYGAHDHFGKGFSDFFGLHSPVPRRDMSFNGQMNSALSRFQQEYGMGNLFGPQLTPGRSDGLMLSSPWQKTKEQTYYQRGSSVSDITNSLSRLSMADPLYCAQQDGVNLYEERDELNLLRFHQFTHPRPHLSVENLQQYGLPLSNGRTRAPLDNRIPQGRLEAFTNEDTFIMEGQGLSYSLNKGLDGKRGENKDSSLEIGAGKRLERKPQMNSRPFYENAWDARMHCPLPLKCNSLVEAQGHIFLLAKDQYGCRFLQRIFNVGTLQDVKIIFNEVIDHVVELMMNPFGNYLMQRLLDVCTEEQRLQILFMATQKPGQLVETSLNTHGTRVVQKLIETLKTRQQILLVTSALEPGFLALIKDLNGNHVIQRCLQCLSAEDNNFIFVAAAKYSVDIATHQHGCCVLQRCISHSTGEHREKLVEEISANGLLLAQDAYGNYVVQFVLELKIPSATSTLISQFEGKYVHLSMQKFSSHVVEKCLIVLNNERRSRIIHELLSSPRFEQLLQDPHANYVVQKAIEVSEGPLHNFLVEKIMSHKAISRNSPFSKGIFSQKLLKK